jgi:hypothetical protein
MPWGMARRMSPQAPGRKGEPSADVLGGVGETVEAAEGGLNNSNHYNQLGFIKGRIIIMMMMMMMSCNRK